MTKEFRNPADIVQELEEELKYIPQVPMSELSARQQQVELSTSCTHITQLISEIISYESYIVERLKHSETERFK